MENYAIWCSCRNGKLLKNIISAELLNNVLVSFFSNVWKPLEPGLKKSKADTLFITKLWNVNSFKTLLVRVCVCVCVCCWVYECGWMNLLVYSFCIVFSSFVCHTHRHPSRFIFMVRQTIIFIPVLANVFMNIEINL